MIVDANGDTWTAKQIPGVFSRREWLVPLLLSIFVGVFDIDRFYLGKIGTGILKLLTFGGFTIWAIINSVVEQTPLKDVIVEVLTAVDAILLGTVLLVIGYGLYELFVDTELDVPAWLQIKDLDDLKSKLIGVVVAIIAVVFVGVLVDSTRAGDVLAYGTGADAVVLGLGVFAWATRKSASPDKK